MWVKLIKNKNAWMKTNQMFIVAFDHISEHFEFVKNTLLCAIFSNLFSAFGNVVKHALLCLIYYLRNDFIHT